MARIFWGHLQVALFTILWFKWSVKKHCVAKVLLAIWEIFLHENNCNYNSYRFSYKFAFIFFLSFIANQKQESGFQQVCGLVMRRISVFCFWRVTLYLIAMSNSIDCYKGIFLHVIPVRIIVSWRKKTPCYMHDSAWRWFIVKKAKMFWSYVKHFWILAGVRKKNVEFWMVCVDKLFLNCPTIFLD